MLKGLVIVSKSLIFTVNKNTMKAQDLNKNILKCPCCKSNFDNSKIDVNNEVYGDLLCLECTLELNKFN